MKTKILIITLLCIIMLPMVLADTEIHQINQDIDLRFTCTSNGEIPVGALFNISISYPNGSAFINNKQASEIANAIFNYTTNFPITGLYKVEMVCIDGTNTYLNSGWYDLTPTGVEQTSILDNPLLLIMGAIGIVILIFSMVYGMPFMGFIASVIFILLGIYTMLYGFNNTIDMYTRGTALVIVGIGIFVMFASAYDWVFGGNNE